MTRGCVAPLAGCLLRALSADQPGDPLTRDVVEWLILKGADSVGGDALANRGDVATLVTYEGSRPQRRKLVVGGRAQGHRESERESQDGQQKPEYASKGHLSTWAFHGRLNGPRPLVSLS